MFAKILISLGVLVYLALIPFLEINESHVFNAQWPAHARFHEVWQLTTHMMLGVMALWLAWFKQQIIISAGISIAIMGGVLFAHIIEASYGGSVLSGNTSQTVMGLELAAFAAALVIVMSVIAIVLDRGLFNK
ncbi:MAG: hypothetical protein JXR16_05975 [Bermanella sp.]